MFAARWLSRSRRAKARPIGGFRLAQPPEIPPGCPLAFEQCHRVEFQPQRRAPARPEPHEAAAPARQKCRGAQPHLDPPRRPPLPAPGGGPVAQEAGPWQGLLDLFAEPLDLPPAALELRPRPRRPRKVVGQENPRARDALHRDERPHPAPPWRIIRPARTWGGAGLGRRAKSCPPVSCSGVGPPGTAGCPGRGGPGTRRVRSNQTRDRRPRKPCPTTRFRPRGRRRRPRGRAGRRGRGRGQGARRAAGSWANPNAGDTGRRPGGGAAWPRPAPGRRGGGWGRPRQGGRLCNGARAVGPRGPRRRRAKGL